MEKEKPCIRVMTRLNISREIDGGRCTVHFPEGCPPDVHSPCGNQSAVLQFFNLSYLTLEIHDTCLPDTYLDYHTLYDNRLPFIGSVKLEVDQRFYTTPFLGLPFDVLSTLSYVGKTSFSEILEFENRVNKLCFAKMYMQAILLDANARKPTELPSFWRDRYGKMSTGSPLIVESLTRPQRCILSSSYKIRASDIDNQKHTNYSTFVRLCVEEVKKAAINECFEKFSAKTLENGMQSFEIRYENEALLGDEVTVHVWKAADRSDQLCFEITKGPDVCIQATMTFYQTPISICKSGSVHPKL